MPTKPSPSLRHKTMSALLRRKAPIAATPGFSSAAAAAPAAATKAVTFHASNAGHLVAITSGSIHFVFSGSGGADFPIGDNDVFFAVKGAGNKYSITCVGGKPDQPMEGALSDGKGGGMCVLTV